MGFGVSIRADFRQGMIPRIIENFPYPEKFCPFCESKLTLQEAIHSSSEPYYFKALLMCLYEGCEAYDLPSRKAYVKVYYSSQEAYDSLKTNLIYWNEKVAK